MSNEQFRDICYMVESNEEFIKTINEFLEDSVDVPEEDLENVMLLSAHDIKELAERTIDGSCSKMDIVRKVGGPFFDSEEIISAFLRLEGSESSRQVLSHTNYTALGN